MKTYKCMWLQDDGTIFNLGERETNNPKMFLFEKICEMIVTAGNIFKPDGKPEQIHKWIQTGKSEREHYFANIGDQAISVMEMNYKAK